MSTNPPSRGAWDLGAIVGGSQDRQPVPPAVAEQAPPARPGVPATPAPPTGPAAPSPLPDPPLPDPPRPRHAVGRSARPLVLVGLVLAVSGALGAVAVGLRHGEDARPAISAPVAGPPLTTPAVEDRPPTPAVEDRPPTPAVEDPSTSGPSPPDTEEEVALDALHQLRERDLPTVQLGGQYVAQLASKTVGIVDQRQLAANGSHTFYATDILAEHLDLRDDAGLDHPVVLLLSTDYGRRQRYQGQPLWVTMALGPFDAASAVRAWCAAHFPGLSDADLENQCTPRRLEPPHG